MDRWHCFKHMLFEEVRPLHTEIMNTGHINHYKENLPLSNRYLAFSVAYFIYKNKKKPNY